LYSVKGVNEVKHEAVFC